MSSSILRLCCQCCRCPATPPPPLHRGPSSSPVETNKTDISLSARDIISSHRQQQRQRQRLGEISECTTSFAESTGAGGCGLSPSPPPLRVQDVGIILRHHHHKLMTAIQDDPVTIAGALYSSPLGLISEIEHDKVVSTAKLTPIEQASSVLGSLKRRVSVDNDPAAVLSEVCDCLEHTRLPVLTPVINSIRTTLEPDVSQEQQSVDCEEPLSSQSLKYRQHLIEWYLRHQYPTYFKDVEINHRPKHTITLSLVHKKKGKADIQRQGLLYQAKGNVDEIKKIKSPLTIDKIGIVSDGVTPQCILVEGPPGIGKTTFAWNLCRKWGEGELLTQWNLVILVQLRSPRVRKADCLSDLLGNFNPNDKDAVCQEMIDRAGKGVMFLFEGYDELSDDQRDESSVFQQLLRKELLPRATVLITSRPLSRAMLPYDFRENIDQHIEVVGFTQKGIQEYIKLSCEGQSPVLLEDLQLYMSQHPFVESSMHNPLHCSIVTELYLYYWKQGEKAFAPNSLTELYQLLLLYLLYREHGVKVNNLKDLPKPLNDELMKLAELAAKGIVNRQYIFEKLPSFNLGLMQSVEEQFPINSTCCTFTHHTLQEFLAALHFSQLSPKQLTRLLTKEDLFPMQQFIQPEKKDDLNDEEMHWPVLLFLCGLTKLTDIPPNLIMPRTYFSKEEMINVKPSLCQLLFEAQSSQLVPKVFTGRRFSVNSYDLKSPLDWFVLGYCVAHISCCSWELRLNSFSTPQCFHMYSKGLHYSPTTASGETGSLRGLSLINQHNISQCFNNLPTFQAQTIETLELMDSKYPSEGVLHELDQYFPALRSLVLNGDYSRPDITAVFISNSPHLISAQLVELKLHYVTIQNSSCLVDALSSADSRLQLLKLDRCSIIDSNHTNSDYQQGYQQIIRALVNSKLTSFVSKNMYIEAVGKTLAEFLVLSKTLKYVKAKDLNMSIETSKLLVNSLNNSNVEKLVLDEKCRQHLANCVYPVGRVEFCIF